MMRPSDAIPGRGWSAQPSNTIVEVREMDSSWNDQTEWLETDGLGGFASGTAGGICTRRYHGVLLAAARPPSGRGMLANGGEGWAPTPAGRFPLSSQRYEGQVVAPEGFRFVRSFTT